MPRSCICTYKYSPVPDILIIVGSDVPNPVVAESSSKFFAIPVQYAVDISNGVDNTSSCIFLFVYPIIYAFLPSGVIVIPLGWVSNVLVFKDEVTEAVDKSYGVVIVY